MNKYYEEFMELFQTNNKDECLLYCMEGIEREKFTIPELYEGILKPALYNIDTCHMSDPGCIWKEHLKTGIVRTIIEGMYLKIIKLGRANKSLGKKILLVNPEREYHEIGLRMTSDFFQIQGYETLYIGTNTPKSQIKEAIVYENPDYIGISVTDFYLLSESKKIVKLIRENQKKEIIIILAGQAFKKNRHLVEEIGGDLYLESYRDVVKLSQGESI